MGSCGGVLRVLAISILIEHIIHAIGKVSIVVSWWPVLTISLLYSY